MPLILGLTGSIAMGKTTTASLFRQYAVPVFDADACVHSLYTGKAVPVLMKHFPRSVHNGVVDRRRLSSEIAENPEKLTVLETLIHPLVHEEQRIFLENFRINRIHLAVLDVPLLFETGNDRICDAVAVVSAPEQIQKERVLKRPGMNEDKFQALLKRQLSDIEKRRRSHFLIETGRGLEAAEKQVRDIMRCLAYLEKSIARINA